MTYEIEVLSWSDRKKWNEIGRSFENWDLYFTPEYSKVYENIGDGKVQAFVYKDDNLTVLYPYLLKKVNDLAVFDDLEEEYFDIASPYGYCGPLFSEKTNDKNQIEKSTESFFEAFHKYCKENNIVTEFVRFHPILNNAKLARKHIKTEFQGKTVASNLRRRWSDMWDDEFDSDTRSKIRKSIRNDIQVNLARKDEIKEIMPVFKKLYYSTMDKNDARDYYYFDHNYFKGFEELLLDDIIIFYAIHNKKIIAASLVMVKSDYVHIHLTGSKKEFLNLGCNNLIRYRILEWAKFNKFSYVHHGGGKESLLKFKKGFSNLSFNFHIGRKVHNQKKYSKLKQIWKKKNEVDDDNFDYLPIYRLDIE
ncbi:GNAT family N-acetyltransferase [Fuchsiella alkaliacetigena]|uniref:GNAT family N-acetyltransferase n=1 Tax=Fuchsiella alkaliacetigena TaxID=957042 RepID=UPI00200A42B4|nr:GNAT family N-acetyltransferase [Fuchsiella alkaliacetigena]MCK8824335.1 GNAT family N-acetyltransferase [Fuchsiella alkaliacetigena]